MESERGRFKKVFDRKSMALPAVDFFTGSDKDEFFVDTDRDTDEGRIYLSKHTVEQLAKLIGWIPNEFTETTVQQRYRILEEENAYLRNTINLIVDALHRADSVLVARFEPPQRALEPDPVPQRVPPEKSGNSSKVSKRVYESPDGEGLA